MQIYIITQKREHLNSAVKTSHKGKIKNSIPLKHKYKLENPYLNHSLNYVYNIYKACRKKYKLITNKHD